MSTYISASWAAIIRAAIDAELRQLHVGLPARVESFDASKGTVDVRPVLMRRFIHADATETVDSIPVIEEVPIGYPGGGGWSLTFPLAVGDVVYLAFSERSLDQWKLAPLGDTIDPGDARRHHLSDAIAIARLHTPESPPAALSAANLRLGRDDRSAELELAPDGAVTLRATTLNLGGPAAFGSGVRGEPLEILLTAIGTAIGEITGSGASAGTAIAAAIQTAKSAGLFVPGVKL